MEIPPTIPIIQQRPSQFPLWWVVVVNGLVCLLMIQFYWVPRGAQIRPMGCALFVVMLTFVGLVAIPVIVPTLWRRPRMVWPWVALFLALTPFPLAQIILWHAQKVCGFILEP